MNEGQVNYFDNANITHNGIASNFATRDLKSKDFNSDYADSCVIASSSSTYYCIPQQRLQFDLQRERLAQMKKQHFEAIMKRIALPCDSYELDEILVRMVRERHKKRKNNKIRVRNRWGGGRNPYKHVTCLQGSTTPSCGRVENLRQPLQFHRDPESDYDLNIAAPCEIIRHKDSFCLLPNNCSSSQEVFVGFHY